MQDSKCFDTTLIKTALTVMGEVELTRTIKLAIKKAKSTKAKKAQNKRVAEFNRDKGFLALVNLGFIWVSYRGVKKNYTTICLDVNNITPEREENLKEIWGKHGITAYDSDGKPIYHGINGQVIPDPGPPEKTKSKGVLEQ